jgi:hypothetical protein
VKIRRINSLASLDLRDYVQRGKDTYFPFGAVAYVDFTKDNRITPIAGPGLRINGFDLEYPASSVSSGTGVYVPGHERTSVLGGAVAYDFSFTPTSPLGLRVQSASRNQAWRSNDFSQAVWVKTNATITDSVQGPNGNTASRMTATAANASITQARTGISSLRRFAVFAKSATSAEVPFLMSMNNFATSSTCNATQSWTHFWFTQTLATPTFGIRLPDNGTAIDLWAVDIDSGTGSSVPMTEVLINTTSSTFCSVLSGGHSFGITEFVADGTDTNQKQEATLYYEVNPARGSGTTLLVACEDNQFSAGEFYISITDNEIAISGSDALGNDIDQSEILNDPICRISIIYKRSPKETWLYINDTAFGPFEMGFPVSITHEGDSFATNRTQHYVRKIGLWDRVLSIGELRQLWNGAAE